MRQENGTKTKYPGIYSLSDGTFRIVAKAVDPKTGRARFKEQYTREMDPAMTQNAAVAYRSELIDQIKTGLTVSGTPTRILRLETLCRSSWVPSGPVAGPKSRDGGRDGSGRGRESDDEPAVVTAP